MEQKKQAGILLVGFGNLSDFAKEAAHRFPDYKISFARSAAEGLKQIGLRRVLVQPAFLLTGIEYDKIRSEAKAFGDTTAVGHPLLPDNERIEKLADILEREYCGKTVLFIGHGTSHPAGEIYRKLYLALKKKSLTAFMGVLDGNPKLETALSEILHHSVNSILLVPLMMTAGKHVKEEITGDTEGSWRSLLEQQGIKTSCVDKGLLAYPPIREMIFASIEQSIYEGINK
ncbi:sirohydrochlorin cobaltochelatase [Ruminiclostridium sufflavum DSM 19573]|uniref:Sirohydrochlorin cobaltochelatase n=1 Tax=Ruminiclostridium sufflavum DSM 19573 TaxID=1121337 RepID=A0A318XJ28_9FIRM|nr:sirohydrochlorin cobaltochelatase [Ruminiclostridium sufflavum]PYG84859.1 sirohydrochlorin cobaltochelatase [Ruminiclostridium sufflavum DSM 19573]